MPPPRTVLVQLNSLELGGTQLNAIDMAKAVEAFGYESRVFGPLNTLPATGPNLFAVGAERGVPIEGYWPARNVIPTRARALNKRFRAAGADIMHVYGTYGDPRSAYWGPCLVGQRPFVHTVYEMSVEPKVYRHTSLVIGTRYLEHELARRPGPTTLISPPVDVAADAPNALIADAFRSSLGGLGNRLIVAVISRLDKDMKSYAIETAIRAMSRLERSDALLVVVGTGSDEERLKGIGDEVNATAEATLVHFTGAMSDPRPVYAAADIMLGMGSSAARSLAFARPLIVQGEGGTAEVFTDATSDSLFSRSFWSQAQQPQAEMRLAKALIELLDDSGRREQLGSLGRAFAIEHFSLTAMAAKLAGVYDRAVTAYGAGSWVRDLACEVPQLTERIVERVRGAHRMVGQR